MAKIKKTLLCCFIGVLLSSCNLSIEDTLLRQAYESNHLEFDNILKSYDKNYEKSVLYNEGDRIKLDKIEDVNIDYKNVVAYIYEKNKYISIVYEFDNEEQAQETAVKLNAISKIDYFSDEKLVYNDSYYANIMLGDYIIDGDFVFTKDKKTLLTTTSNDNKIYLPDVEIIKPLAFDFHLSIKEIICNDNLKQVSEYGFAGCSNLNNIQLNNRLSKIERYAFNNCKNLTSIIIPESVKFIGYQAINVPMVYCEAEAKPEGWDKNFAATGAKIYYKGEWEYNEFGKPFPISANY